MIFIDMKIKLSKLYLLAGMLLLPMICSCEKNKSYSELLKEEEHAVNLFLADQNIVPYIPEDGNFEVGTDAPFYKMDENGYVYMQIIDRGDMSERPEKGERVYFRFKYRNLKDLANGYQAAWTGNADNLELTSTSLIYGNTVITSTTSWGEGIQVPLEYVGYNSEVNLVIKSPMGLVNDQTNCIPYEYNVKYFKAEY